MTSPSEREAAPAGQLANHPRNLSEVVKFTALAAVLAIFIDAAIGHAMIWGNDPYWTYWITDTLLMATVFGLGTMVFGIGIGIGALITAVHVTLLTTYYWSLSPIGLPSQPEWLDFEHTWATGLPIHLAVYYMGYLGALWLWGRRTAAAARHEHAPQRSLPQIGAAALAVTAVIVVAIGIAQTLVLQEFPGVTWFVMRLAVAFPFTVAWWMMAGTDRTSAIAGGISLALLLTTYSHFLGPVGLPSDPARLLTGDSPSAIVQWLTYREEFMVMLPISAGLASICYLMAARWHGTGLSDRWPTTRKPLFAGLAAAAGLVLLGMVSAPDLGPEGNRATFTSRGAASVAHSDGGGMAADAAASLRMTVENGNTHRTPLPPHDKIDLAATVPGPNGSVYEIRATQPMVAEPAGRFTTWQGVGFGKWHDGRSRIGLGDTPARQSDVVVFALGEVRTGGQLVATGVPVQVSATGGDERVLELHVGNAGSTLIPGSLQVRWQDFSGGYSHESKHARYLFGGGVLLVLLGFTFAAAWRQRAAQGGRRR